VKKKPKQDESLNSQITTSVESETNRTQLETTRLDKRKFSMRLTIKLLTLKALILTILVRVLLLKAERRNMKINIKRSL